LTDPFDKTIENTQYLTFEIEINGLTVSNTLQQEIQGSPPTGMSLLTSTVSPVLKSDIIIQLPTEFPYTLNREDFSVNVTNNTALNLGLDYYVTPTERYLRPIAVDDDAKTLTVKFGGSWSGQWQLVMRHAEMGLLDTEGLVLDVNTYVTNYYPTSGSYLGGTLITIEGSNFGTVFTDNPVQLSTNGGFNSVDCFVQTITKTLITCRVDTNIEPKDVTRQAEIIVFLKVSEEALCQYCKDNMFTYTMIIPTIESVEAVFDTDLLQWTVVASGIDFEGDANSVDLLLTGTTQSTTEVTSTSAKFTIIDVNS